jgi:hypothetical protein
MNWFKTIPLDHLLHLLHCRLFCLATKLLHALIHEKISKEKAAKQSVVRHKEQNNGSNRAQRRGQAGWSSQQVLWTCKSQKISNHVSLTDKCPIYPDSAHMWGDCYQNKDKKVLAKGTELGKSSIHNANIMDIEPTEKVTHCASSKSQRLTKKNSPEMSLMLICWVFSTRP